MKIRMPARAVLAVVLIFFAGISLAARQDAPAVTPDGLHLVPDTVLGLVYADPEADLSGYGRILLMDAQVAFKKDWQRDVNQARPFNVTDADMQRIKTSLAELFREIFSEALTTGGYILTGEQAPDVLLVRPAILDLNVRAPESSRATTTRNLSESAGDMTLYLELRDSVTGDILIKALDFQIDRTNVTPFMMDRTRNENAARRLLSNWAEVLVEGLGEARAAVADK